MAQPAVFLDRDGVLNALALNPANGEWESPHRPEEVLAAPGLAQGLALLAASPYQLFVVSNQPSAAKGKCTLEDLKAVHAVVALLVAATGASIQEWYYCHHHPQGVVPELSGPCPCRKPGTFFLEDAAARHGIDLARSWFVGDSDADIACGRAKGCRTILIEAAHSEGRRGSVPPHHRAADLAEAAAIILKHGGPA
jgi:D-glycero-D-manno-heptose 1,7-bisphosphate phosphatase